MTQAGARGDDRPAYGGPPGPSDPLLTKAEATEFKETTSYTDVIGFLDRALAEDEKLATSPGAGRRGRRLRQAIFGRTGEGRDLPFVIVGSPPVTDPRAAAATGKLVVLLLNNIHAGETDAKDASLILLRQAVRGELDRLLEKVILLVVPIYNADGNERFDAMNRLTQLGPEGSVGERVNARGLDLNRDYMKLEAVEAQALVGTLFGRWLPHAIIDGHTTDGSRLRWVLTYGAPQNPAGHAAPIAYTRDRLLPAARDLVLRRTGWGIGPYGNFTDPAHPEKGYETYTSQPRFGASYFGLQNRISVLSESYSYGDYRTRVLATLEFERAVLDRLAEDRDEVLSILGRAESETIAAGAGDGTTTFPIACEKRPFADPIVVPSYELEDTNIDGTVHLVATTKPRDYTVRYAADFVPTRTVLRPFAYLIPVHEPGLVDTLRMHGVVVKTLSAPVDLEVERYRVTRVKAEAKPFQGHRTVSVKALPEKLRLAFPSGTFVVPMAQRAANVAAYLCEPETDDGFVTWNRLDTYVAGPIDPDPEEIAVFEQSLIDLPKARELWRRLEIPAGVSEPEARTEFLARAIGYRSRTANMIPIYRLLRRTELPIAP